ncbi:MAG: alpha/beta hydrolase [Fibrobacterota bacterium]|nr:alpha/beta hydrolase [Fibrobacterota bacterium]QQS06030.1 MAG: alpha/beta hydrolase [Fibrobacterota bacterium]
MHRSKILWVSVFVGVCASSLYADPIQDLQTYLATKRESRAAITAQGFYQTPLTKAQAQSARDLLWKDQVDFVTRTEKASWDAGAFSLNGYTMKFKFKVFGAQPARGRALFLSMHGGGSTTADVNDEQWANQLLLYTPSEGVYLCPRAPTDSWNMWHQSHIDSLFERIIQAAVAFRSVDPNRVYVMGYSAGGDGAYQLAPRMADRWAAAAMMAGHPNDASPLSLRNIGFTLHVGALDAAYDRNLLVPQWGKTLDSLRKLDPGGYQNLAQVHAGKPHWMDQQDTVAVRWMMGFTRNPRPDRVVWKQDDVFHDRFYWLGLPPSQVRKGSLVVASRSGQDFKIEQSDLDTVRIFLEDSLADLDRPIQVQWKSGAKVAISPARTIQNLWESLLSKTDKNFLYSSSIKAYSGMVSSTLPGFRSASHVGFRAFADGASGAIRFEVPVGAGRTEITILDPQGDLRASTFSESARGVIATHSTNSGLHFVRFRSGQTRAVVPVMVP